MAYSRLVWACCKHTRPAGEKKENIYETLPSGDVLVKTISIKASEYSETLLRGASSIEDVCAECQRPVRVLIGW